MRARQAPYLGRMSEGQMKPELYAPESMRGIVASPLTSR
jgi:hypothetical protein